MSLRLLITTAIVVASIAPAPAATPPGKAWVSPRTPDGQPDLQGVWTNATITPFERPDELAEIGRAHV